MTIPERFQKLMNSEGLTASQFADEIGVQRSSLSHILSGRNNPGYDYILKILKRFDNLDANWLMTGAGEMYKSNSKPLVNPKNDRVEIEFHTSKKEELRDERPPVYDSKDKLQMREDKTTGNQNEIVKIIEYYLDDTFKVFYPKK